MSKSGFAFSAAYSTVPVRGVWMQRDVDACTWSNYNDHCLMRACPGQVCCPRELSILQHQGYSRVSDEGLRDMCL
jgi:hypothetical protein